MRLVIYALLDKWRPQKGECLAIFEGTKKECLTQLKEWKKNNPHRYVSFEQWR